MRRIIALCAIAFIAVFAALSAFAQVRAKLAKAAPAAPAPAYGNADAIHESELKVYEYYLASDQLEGRNFPSRGFDTAALYIASHLAEWGLKPGGSASATDGPLQPYFMPIELVSHQVVPEESKVSLTAPSQGGRGGGDSSSEPRTTNFEYAKDWTSGSGGGGRGGRGAQAAEQPFDVSGSLVFAGNGYVINKSQTDPYQGIDVHGKIIVVAGLPRELAALAGGAGRGGAGGRGGRGGAGDAPAQAAPGQAATGQTATPQAAQGRGATPGQNPLGEPCKDYLSPEQYAAKNGALAVVSVANFQQLGAMSGGGRGPSLNGPNYQVKNFPQTSTCPSAPAITAGVELTNAIFQGEKLSGAQVFYATGSNTKQDSFELDSHKKLNIHVAMRHSSGHGENVVAILEGGDPVLKNEFILLTAHLDHIGLSAPLADGHNVNNGADDDGSGSTGLMAIAHAYADGAAKGMRPKRSVIFLWVGGEEKGLLGSQYFARFPPVDLAKVVADLNMDMIGRSKNPKSVDPDKSHVLVNPGEVLLIGPNISSDDLEQTIETVNNNYQKLVLNHFYDVTAPDATHDNLNTPNRPGGQGLFRRSDHYNFARMGIPIAFFTTGLHVDYHRATDTPEKIDYAEMAQIAKTVAAVSWQLTNQPARPKLNDKLPDDLVRDMKTSREQGWGKITPVAAPLPGEPQ